MPESTPSLFETALARLRRRGAALGTGVLLTLPVQAACVEALDTSAAESFDWAQFEGKRNTEMVSLTGDWSTNCAGGNTRFGCGATAIHLDVRVRPAAHADLAWKRVGVIYRSPDDGAEHTALGTYASTYANGDEQWRVTVTVPQHQNVIVFDAWYQDGAGSTWLDDNEGELHVVNAGPAYQVVRVEPWLGTVTVGERITGRISLQVTDLDFDKQLELVASKDGWQSKIHLGMGSAGDTNKWYWVEDLPFAGGRERWQIDLDLPATTEAGAADTFEYAVVYRHGVVNNARTYAFWDNNLGSNYVVERPVVQ